MRPCTERNTPLHGSGPLQVLLFRHVSDSAAEVPFPHEIRMALCFFLWPVRLVSLFPVLRIQVSAEPHAVGAGAFTVRCGPILT